MSSTASTPTLFYSCRIAENAFLCYGVLEQPLTGKEHIFIDGIKAQKPLLAARLQAQQTQRIIMIVRTEEGSFLDGPASIQLQVGSATTHWIAKNPADDKSEKFADFLQSLAWSERTKTYHLLLKFAQIQSSSAQDPRFLSLCQKCTLSLEHDAAKITGACWLSPHILYVEANVPTRAYDDIHIIHSSAQAITTASINVLMQPRHADLNSSTYPMVMIFPKPMQESIGNGHAAIITKDALIPLAALHNTTESNLAGFISYLKTLPENNRFSIRDFVNRSIISLAPSDIKAQSDELVRSLQSYIVPPHATVYDLEQPFGLNVEFAASIHQDYIYLSGWIHDPLLLLEHIQIHADTGFQFDISPYIQRFAYADILEFYEGASFPANADEAGFIALVPLPDTIKELYAQAPQPMHFRIATTLTSGLRYIVAPKPTLHNALSIRTGIVEHSANKILPSDSAARTVRQAAQLAQLACSDRIDVAATYHFGRTVPHPKVSIIIPLYQELDYLPAQLAHFAGDHFITQQTEIIYVLDSPQQHQQLKRQLDHLTHVYRLDVTLLVLNDNGGYACATNIGVAHAKAEHVLLMNSDVVPISNGWLQQLLDYYTSYDDIGALAPKLLFEDGGIQHAGMYFEKDITQQFYENQHFFKGYPASYPEACVTRTVPAVSGACLLIRKTLYDTVDGLSTDYIIGDYEDSDLCLKIYNAGFYNCYFADVSLYHFERQSFIHASGSTTARYWLNATIHHERWKTLIETNMHVGDAVDAA